MHFFRSIINHFSPPAGLAHLIQRIDEGDDIAIDDLPEDLRESFISSMKTGAISNLVSEWTPWWDKHDVTKLKARVDGTSLVAVDEDADADGDADDERADELPPLPRQPLPPLCSLVANSASLSDSLKYHVVSILYSYCFAKYVYNGDWSNDVLETSLCTVEVSGVLEFAGYGKPLNFRVEGGEEGWFQDPASSKFERLRNCATDLKHIESNRGRDRVCALWQGTTRRDPKARMPPAPLARPSWTARTSPRRIPQCPRTRPYRVSNSSPDSYATLFGSAPASVAQFYTLCQILMVCTRRLFERWNHKGSGEVGLESSSRSQYLEAE